MRRFAGVVLVLTLAGCATAPKAPVATRELGFDRANLDPTVNACTDFFRYTNGGWMAKNPIPGTHSAWGYGSIVNESNRVVLREVLEKAASKPAAQRTANEQKIGDFYRSCMAEDAINAAGTAPIQADLDRINAISNTAGLVSMLARFASMDFDVPFDLSSVNDSRNSAEVIAEISQDGLGLPDRDYYFKTDERSQKTRDEYVKHVATMLRLAGADAATADRQAQAVMRLETAIAAASMTRVEQRNPEAIYNRMTLTELATMAPGIDWPRFLADAGAPVVTSINVAQPKFAAEVSRQLTATPLDDWKAYLRWQLLSKTASSLSKPFDDENFRFRGMYLAGQKEQLPRWQRCVSRINAQVGEALGQAYVDQKFGPEAKRRATELVENLVAALHEELSKLDWMSAETKQQALTKLAAFTRKIGYPDRWRDYSALQVTADSYAANVIAANRFDNRRSLMKIGQPVDRSEWYMTPPTYNAYYNPPMNEIVFPAGILQWPMFDIGQDDAFNYGAIGSVIGHELTHGFDDEGSQYDAQGNLRNWWTAEDRKLFEERAECIVRQFDKYEIEPGLAHSGKLVAGESIADLGGVIIAYNAWKRSLQGKPAPGVVDGFTPEQRFFLGFARARASNITPESARLRVSTDPHPVNEFRVNGPLSNLPEFARAFGCSTNDAMVRADRCEIW